MIKVEVGAMCIKNIFMDKDQGYGVDGEAWYKADVMKSAAQLSAIA